MTDGKEQGTDTQGNDAVGAALAEASGKAVVRRVLIAALDGLGPRRGQTVAAMQAEQEEVARKLSYMTEANLAGLAECALRMAGVLLAGQHKAPAWPQPAQLYAWAYVLQFPPPVSSDYIGSLMRSRMGDRAMDQGWHVELYRRAHRGPPPPNAFIIDQLREDASQRQRQLNIAREWVAAGRATPEQHRLLEAWHRAKDEAESMIEAGRAARAARAAEGQAAA